MSRINIAVATNLQNCISKYCDAGLEAQMDSHRLMTGVIFRCRKITPIIIQWESIFASTPAPLFYTM
jgi:hypothetical protein